MKSLIPWFNKRESNLMERNRDLIQKFFDNPLSNFGLLSDQMTSQIGPAIDISEDSKSVCVKAEVPGMSEKDLDITYSDGVLNIKGEKKEEYEDKKENSYYRESWYGSFNRSIPLGNNMDWKHVDAHYKNGNLTITIPKVEGAEKKVKINVAS